ncbi:MAG: [FeFe] hydrogenase H-cluster radical SAM maturase HydE [Candidatus Riflebacteria bacterium]|nr:[FeFe] hydrogenase H-cluster radical SAM maturase HydE [Candidatus Riflebacteria bacterium]
MILPGTPETLIEKCVARSSLSDAEATFLFSPAFDTHRTDLYAAADRVRSEMVGDDVYLRGLIEYSNYCTCRCAYCGISAFNADIERYRMSPDEILSTLSAGYDMGFRSFVLQSGEDPIWREQDIVALVKTIKSRFDVAIALSVGEWPRSSLEAFRAAGTDRYLLRIETSDPELFAKLHPDSNWEARHRCLMDLKELGFQVGSGVLVGLPGQNGASLGRDLRYLIGIQPEMVGIGPFIPHPLTPLGNATGGTLDACLTFLALLRLYLPDAFLPATSAMGSIHPDGRRQALKAGANVLMPNISPIENRARYQLYPGKICLNDDALKCRTCVEGWVTAMGRKCNPGHGHIIRRSRPTNTAFNGA